MTPLDLWTPDLPQMRMQLAGHLDFGGWPTARIAAAELKRIHELTVKATRPGGYKCEACEKRSSDGRGRI